MSSDESILEYALRELDDALDGDDEEAQRKAAYAVLRAYQMNRTEEAVESNAVTARVSDPEVTDVDQRQQASEYLGTTAGTNLARSALVIDIAQFFGGEVEASSLQERVRSFLDVERSYREQTADVETDGAGDGTLTTGPDPNLTIRTVRIDADTAVRPGETIPIRADIANLGLQEGRDIRLSFATDGPVSIEPAVIRLDSLAGQETAVGTVNVTASEPGLHQLTLALQRGPERIADERGVEIDVTEPGESVPGENQIDPEDLVPLLAQLGLVGGGAAKYHRDHADSDEQTAEDEDAPTGGED